MANKMYFSFNLFLESNCKIFTLIVEQRNIQIKTLALTYQISFKVSYEMCLRDKLFKKDNNKIYIDVPAFKYTNIILRVQYKWDIEVHVDKVFPPLHVRRGSPTLINCELSNFYIHIYGLNLQNTRKENFMICYCHILRTSQDIN